VRAALARRRDGSDARLDEALELDARRRELLPEVEGLRARQNEKSLLVRVPVVPIAAAFVIASLNQSSEKLSRE